MKKAEKTLQQKRNTFDGRKMLLTVVFFGLFSFWYANAQQVETGQQQIDYQGQPIVDLDLDGLTDQAEDQIYKTDPKNPDSDNDGYYDGTEILAKSDPLDAISIPGKPAVTQDDINQSQNETPWAWYVSRASGLLGFTLLYISIFLALTIRVPFLRKVFAPVYALNAHGWIALQATLFALVHGTVLIFDKFMGFNLIDVLVPLASTYEPALVAMGIIGFYLMLILVVTSYARKHLSFKLWRAVHFLNIILYVGVIVHAYFLGTDMKNEIIRNIFVYANIFLIILMLVNMFIRIKQNIARRNVESINNGDIVR
ncbi:MAG: Ferric reductase domain protein transmembrane component domain protein [Candidatus Moranbacteria bacterium GW2011_GWC2_37_73]|nr:MAG: hypothetical protein UR95_C0006G0125 [Parcubacteria group bacterium GW2011_GWC1_36_108]KKQ00153.1 MAG: Ferric reductase domain protein transmembrane component domain protein [Candidatus Moranbacteria bacterium GW2011_GWD1_36_198]KKQ00201.1 MAG: Ferric reductase domain protein transmembrane component domain protein [Candidatus Moranbacteria bacterium GW2011_GWD2_36_198]KKQ39566.1 MAG: Ferric reductase domain protein transmembrane component domain protein [Candidatus Moranbacteria bacteriu